MTRILQLFLHGSFITRFFIVTGALYIILMAITTIYVYARLDYVRTGVETERANNPQTK